MATSTTAVDPPPYFSHSNPRDPVCTAGIAMRRVEYEFWSSVVPVLDDDADVAFSLSLIHI